MHLAYAADTWEGCASATELYTPVITSYARLLYERVGDAVLLVVVVMCTHVRVWVCDSRKK